MIRHLSLRLRQQRYNRLKRLGKGQLFSWWLDDCFTDTFHYFKALTLLQTSQ